MCVCVCVCVCACVCARARVCVRAGMRACVRVCAHLASTLCTPQPPAAAAGIALSDAATVSADLFTSSLRLRPYYRTHLARGLVAAVLAASCLLSVSRMITLAGSLAAPMAIWPKVGALLQEYVRAWGILEAPLTVCVGKEWFRFPGQWSPLTHLRTLQASSCQGFVRLYLRKCGTHLLSTRQHDRAHAR